MDLYLFVVQKLDLSAVAFRTVPNMIDRSTLWFAQSRCDCAGGTIAPIHRLILAHVVN